MPVNAGASWCSWEGCRRAKSRPLQRDEDSPISLRALADTLTSPRPPPPVAPDCEDAACQPNKSDTPLVCSSGRIPPAICPPVSLPPHPHVLHELLTGLPVVAVAGRAARCPGNSPADPRGHCGDHGARPAPCHGPQGRRPVSLARVPFWSLAVCSLALRRPHPTPCVAPATAECAARARETVVPHPPRPLDRAAKCARVPGHAAAAASSDHGVAGHPAPFGCAHAWPCALPPRLLSPFPSLPPCPCLRIFIFSFPFNPLSLSLLFPHLLSPLCLPFLSLPVLLLDFISLLLPSTCASSE